MLAGQFSHSQREAENAASAVAKGDLANHFHSHGTSLPERLRNLPLLPKACALAGILSVLPAEALTTDLLLEPASPPALNSTLLADSKECKWDLLVDGALPLACTMVETPCDPEVQFHTLGGLTASLQALLARLQVLPRATARPNPCLSFHCSDVGQQVHEIRLKLTSFCLR